MAVEINGDGLITVDGTTSTQGRVRLKEDADNGSNYVELTAPASVTANRTITFPDDTGTVLTNSGNQTGVFSALTVNSNNISADNSLGFRNRIINGDMRIDQRNAGASITPTNGQYSVDRFFCIQAVASKYSAQQNAGSVAVLASTGFSNYLGATSLSAYSVGAGEQFYLAQRIEANNVSDLAWGTASAKTVTISFWVRSSLTGTFGGHIVNAPTFNYSYPFSYTISSANTWEYKTVTIAGPTAGTWNTSGTDTGMQVGFGLGVGSTFSGTANAWASALYYAPTGSTSVVGTNGATFYITGVQLEVGTVATPFERRPYGTELALCQRYYARINATAAYTSFGCALAYGSTNAYAHVNFPVPMRAAPSVSQSNTAYGDITTTTSPVTSLGTAYIGKETGLIQLGFSGGGATTNRAGFWQANNNSAAYVDYSSEL